MREKTGIKAKAGTKEYYREYARLRSRRGRISDHKMTYYLRKRYNMTVDEYNVLLSAQGGVCAICKLPPKNGRRFDVDHNHETGVNRGLLHNICNQALGLLQDNPDLCEAAARYLREHMC